LIVGEGISAVRAQELFMLNVFLTIDTEVYPLLPDWRSAGLQGDISRDIYGETSKGAYGLSYQIDVLNAHRLKAVFFVESLFASAVGPEPLNKIVREIQDGGHEVQLHLHPEWLSWMSCPPFDPAGRGTLNQFTGREQGVLVGMGLQNLRAAGAHRICAFRAGDYAADLDTLSALREQGIPCDSSSNPCYRNSLPDLSERDALVQPKNIEGTWEFPVGFWDTGLSRRRHAQITTASSAELRGALCAAWEQAWHSFVIVSHSFELLKKRRQRVKQPGPDHVVVRRFTELCRFLREHADRFRTCGFGDLDLESIPLQWDRRMLTSPIHRTAGRVLQQLYRRLT
jgi:hypothetical protein